MMTPIKEGQQTLNMRKYSCQPLNTFFKLENDCNKYTLVFKFFLSNIQMFGQFLAFSSQSSIRMTRISNYWNTRSNTSA